ncbi:tRNA-dihydrouridine synthase, partial [Acinetobacter baumannii]|uniref:tRNA-dihydrouridine synthase n=1 Tax=Acinetobacter baumannii TaxID=470 RepID=UPI00189C23C2
YRLKREYPQLTVIINGGIVDVEAVQTHLMHVDGVMLGRAAYRTPWLLAELEHALWGAPLPTRAEVVHGMRDHVLAELARGGQLKHIARHMLGLYQGQPRARRFRRILSEGMHRADADFSLLEQALDAVEPVAQAA